MGQGEKQRQRRVYNANNLLNEAIRLIDLKKVFMKKVLIFALLVVAAGVWANDISGGLPAIRIDTKNEAQILDKKNYVNMTFTLTDPNNPENNVVIENTVDGIRGRGNSTWVYDKKPYRIKFDNKYSLFGLPSSKSWVLLAEYLDPTLMMNKTVFELGDVFNLPYNHTYHHVKLYLNGDYRGVYGLTEQNQVGKGRVDINDKEGWLVEMSAEYDEEPKFKTTNYNLPIMIKSPEFEPAYINNHAYDFIRAEINELCDSLASMNFPENGYRDLINIDIFVDFLMINEIVQNDELSGPRSIYSYKNKDGKISMGPLWDFDRAFFYTGIGFTHFTNYRGRLGKHNFFNRFFQDPIFLVKYKERWNENYGQIIAVSNFIDSIGTELTTAAEENFEIWNTSNNYARQIESMKIWWNNRCLWLNAELNKIEVLPKSKIFATQTFGYSEEISPQTFTFVAYGDMANLSVKLQKEESSEFEISTELSKTPTGNGGYLAEISVKPKASLSVAAYTDILILSGINQGDNFEIKVPLSFEVTLETESGEDLSSSSSEDHSSSSGENSSSSFGADSSSSSSEDPSSSSSEDHSSSSGENSSSSSGSVTLIRLLQIATADRASLIYNGISLQAKNNAIVEVFNLNGVKVSRQDFSSGVYTIPFGHLSKGMYIVKVSFGNGKQMLWVPVL